MDTMSNKSLKIVIVFLSICLIWTSIRLSNEKQNIEPTKMELVQTKKSLDSLKIVSDSLYYELFPIQVELGRFQVAYEIFMERNPKAASQYGDIISQETE
jgi:hypothetical protein